MNHGIPLEDLEKRASAERAQLHRSVDDLRQLKTNAEETVRERLDVRRQARQHFWPAAGAASLVALVFGYSLAGMFFD
ncbi:hypothetical protein [Candidatus Korobacter versatilis]|uniref:hypothetical protein n=1 Tax=Candidatus Korobacter versatilis TaxID=658062 RepID=UPI00030C7928|nr:hypothetical protein [Candidatus Koribacter versatilis]